MYNIRGNATGVWEEKVCRLFYLVNGFPADRDLLSALICPSENPALLPRAHKEAVQWIRECVGHIPKRAPPTLQRILD
jgi:hypothetical protein